MSKEIPGILWISKVLNGELVESERAPLVTVSEFSDDIINNKGVPNLNHKL